MKLPMLSADDISRNRRLYFKTTKATIQQDLEGADLLKSMGSEEERERASSGSGRARMEWEERCRELGAKNPMRLGQQEEGIQVLMLRRPSARRDIPAPPRYSSRSTD